MRSFARLALSPTRPTLDFHGADGVTVAHFIVGRLMRQTIRRLKPLLSYEIAARGSIPGISDFFLSRNPRIDNLINFYIIITVSSSILATAKLNSCSTELHL
jgi:hypothetical protein